MLDKFYDEKTAKEMAEFIVTIAKEIASMFLPVLVLAPLLDEAVKEKDVVQWH